MSYLIKPTGYKALLNLSQTEMGIKKSKNFSSKPIFRITVTTRHRAVVRFKRDGNQ